MSKQVFEFVKSLKDLSDAELKGIMNCVISEQRRRKLAAFNDKLAQLFAEAEAEGIRFALVESDDPCCTILNTSNVEAVA